MGGPPLWGGDWDLRTWPLLAHSRWGGGGALPDSLTQTVR